MTIKVGLLGLGTIGTPVAQALMEGRLNGVKLKGVAVSHYDRPRRVNVPYLADDAKKIIYDPEIGIVVELIGGEEPARGYILAAIGTGKSVVTGNKYLLARRGKEIFDAARGKVNVGYEASVGGGIQIMHVFNSLAPADRITSVKAILNGTSNYILTSMYGDPSNDIPGLSYEEALKEAQLKGFAEADPALDISGRDARDKLAVLAMQLYNTPVNPGDIYCEGLEFLQTMPFKELRRAESWGYVLKSLAIANEHDGKLELRVHPALVKKRHPLGTVSGVENAIYWEGELCGPQMYRGRGAGPEATTSAVLSDINHIAGNIRRGATDNLPTLDLHKEIVGIDTRRLRSYLRVDLKDVPGSLHQITGITTKNDVNIWEVLQREEDSVDIEGVPYGLAAITTHPTEYGSLKRTVEEIGQLECVREKPFLLKLEI